jgi:hypothetical protein
VKRGGGQSKWNFLFLGPWAGMFSSCLRSISLFYLEKQEQVWTSRLNSAYQPRCRIRNVHLGKILCQKSAINAHQFNNQLDPRSITNRTNVSTEIRTEVLHNWKKVLYQLSYHPLTYLCVSYPQHAFKLSSEHWAERMIEQEAHQREAAWLSW